VTDPRAEQVGVATDEPAAPRPVMVLVPERAMEIWAKVAERVTGLAAEYAKEFDRVTLAGPNHLVVNFRPGYAVAKAFCQRPDQTARFENALWELTGQKIRVEFGVKEENIQGAADGPPQRPVSPQQRMREVLEHPLVRRAGELFGAQPLRVDEPAPGE
jgi:hypothetical protein